jgi:hypothetical protein
VIVTALITTTMKKSLLTLLLIISFGNVPAIFAQCTSITQPDTALLCPAVGSSATVSVATDAVSPTYTWQYRVVKPTNLNPAWITITASNAGLVYSTFDTANLTVTRATTILPMKGTQYRVIVGGGSCGAITSNATNLVILDPVKAGKIISAPSVCTGNDLTLQVTDYIGSSFQWETATTASGTFTPLVGETGETYTIVGANATSNKYYRVVVTNDACNTLATTTVKTVKINPLSVPGMVTGGGTMCADSNTTLHLVGYTGTIQWESSKDGVEFDKAPIAAENTPASSYQTTSVSNTQAYYMVGNLKAPTYFRAKVISGACSKTYSNVVACSIGDIAQTSGISPASSTICRGTGITLTVVANGALTWEKSTNYSSPTPTWIVTSNHSDTFYTGNVTVATAYRVRVSVGTCSELSTLYTDVALVNLLPSAVAKPATASVTVPSGKTSTTPLCTSDTSKVLTLTAGYAGAIQWQVSTVSSTTDFVDMDGEIEPSYTVTNPSVGVNYYRAKFTNSCGASVYNTPVAVFYTDCGTGKRAATSTQALDVTAYPNPYVDTFSLDVPQAKTNSVGVVVHDIAGRSVEKRVVPSQDLSGASFGASYPAGIYMITVSHGEEVKTVRVVKR